MSSYLGFVIGGYLLGSILFAYVLPKLTRHIDIREMSEDGNPGTYNAFRYGGVICGICVLLLELLKGFFPVWLCERTAGLQSLWFAAVMAAPVLGHAYSIYHRGRGGKAIAVSFGVLLGLVPAGIWQPLAMLVLFYLLFVFPKMSNGTPFQIRQLPQILKRRQLLGIYLITFLVASAYYTGYSYIEPFLKQVAHLADSWITIVLTLFGAAGLLGSFLFSRLYDKHRYAFIRFIIASVAVALLCLRVASISLYLVILVCVLWGMAVTAFNVAFQAETIKAVPEEASAVAMSLFSGIFNLGIGCGTWLGGTVCNQLSIANIGYAGGIIGVLAVLYCIFRMIPLWKAKQKS